MNYKIYDNGDVSFEYGKDSIDYVKSTGELLINGSPTSDLSACFADSEEDADIIGVYDSRINKFISLSGKEFNIVNNVDEVEI